MGLNQNVIVSPMEGEALKEAIDKDDEQQLYKVLQQHAEMDCIDLIINNLYDGLKGRSCLHRYHRKRSCVSELFDKHGNFVLIFLTAGRVSVEG